MCRGTARFLQHLDWFDSLEFVDFTALPPDQVPVPMEAALSGLPMKTADGRILIGFPAVRRALIRTPLGVGLAWMLYVPGLSRLGAWAYGEIARRRRRACRVDLSMRARQA